MTDADFVSASSHYDATYFATQAAFGQVGAKLKKEGFEAFVKGTDTVIDFGCGGGFLLNALDAARRIGIEINPHARTYAAAAGIEVYAKSEELPVDIVADVVISNHALEHVEDPLGELRKLAVRLKPGGLLVVAVPCDSPTLAFNEDDPNFHLFSWSANNLGNLAKCAGFDVREASEIRTRWPPKWTLVYKLLGFEALRLATHVWGRFPGSRRQVRVVATRKAGK